MWQERGAANEMCNPVVQNQQCSQLLQQQCWFRTPNLEGQCLYFKVYFLSIPSSLKQIYLLIQLCCSSPEEMRELKEGTAFPNIQFSLWQFHPKCDLNLPTKRVNIWFSKNSENAGWTLRDPFEPLYDGIQCLEVPQCPHCRQWLGHASICASCTARNNLAAKGKDCPSRDGLHVHLHSGCACALLFQTG